MKHVGRKFTIVALALLGICAHTAMAQESVVYSFDFGVLADGSEPQGGLISDAQGNLYGTTQYGGAHDGGAVFELLKPSTTGGAWTDQILYSFASVAGSADGQNPLGSLVFDTDGNLYGTTSGGGGYNLNGGVVFELSPGAGGVWTETVLHTFANGNQTAQTDGSQPQANLILDAQGNLYGTTGTGGIDSNGTVFELLKPSTTGGAWTEKTLWNFTGDDVAGDFDAFDPLGGLIFDAQGNLFGTTCVGGPNGRGTVFELSPGTGGAWTEKLLWSFGAPGDGIAPTANLVFDAEGNLYGTTEVGGTSASNGGTVFELSPGTGGVWTEKLLWSFAGAPSDGSEPYDTLIFDPAGNLYGTTQFGGAFYSNATGDLGGTVFELSPVAGGTWTETILHSFGATGTGDGDYPIAGLLADPAGNLYGTTYKGGAHVSYYNPGTVFEIASTRQTPVVTWPAPTAITYGTGLGGAQLDATANVPGSFTYSPEAGTVLPAGLQTLSATFTPSDPSEYTSVTTTVLLSVNKALLTVRETPPQVGSNLFSVGYGDDAPYLSDLYVITGFVNGDTASVVSGSPTVVPDWPAQPNAGTYPLTIGVGTLSAANYNFTAVIGAVIGVTPDPLNIKPISLTTKYGQGLPAFLYNATGLAYGQTLASVLSAAPTITTTASPEPAVGSYGIDLSLAGVTAGPNYTIVTPPPSATLTVTPALLNARATNTVSKYGNPLPSLAYTVTGFVGGDTSSVVSGSASLTTTATAGSPVGTYPITFATGNLHAANYNIDYLGATFTTTPALLIARATRIVITAGEPLPPLTYSVTGFVNGDPSSVVSGSASLTTTATANSPAGTYPITFATQGLSAANYSIDYVGATLTILAR